MESLKKDIGAVIFAMTAGILALATYYAPLTFPLTAFAASLLFTAAVLRSGKYCISAFSIVPVIYLVLALLTGYTAAVLLTAIFLPIGASVSVCIRKKCGFQTVALVSVLSTAVMLLLTAVVFAGQTGGSFADAIKPFTEGLRSFSDIMYDTLVEANGSAAESVASYFGILLSLGKDGFYEQIKYICILYVPVLASIVTIVIATAVYYTVKALPKLMANENTSAMTRFDAIYMRRETAVVFLICNIVNLIVTYFGDSNGAVSMAMIIITGIINIYAFVCAVSIAVFLLRQTKIPKAGRLIIVIMGVIIMPLLPLISDLIPLIGVVDPFINFRIRFGGKKL